MKFLDWLSLVESVDPQQVIDAALAARKNGGICDRAHFGDCKEISQATLQMLQKVGIQARLTGGTFITKPKDDESWDHSWLIINNKWILDPTVDQFFSDLDVDMHTKTPGIYYSHPNWDGNSLKSRYYRSKPIARIQLPGKVL
jgi:hypothetical protein